MCTDCQHEDWILQNLCTSSYSGPSEKEKALIRGDKAGGGVAEVQEADEVPEDQVQEVRCLATNLTPSLCAISRQVDNSFGFQAIVPEGTQKSADNAFWIRECIFCRQRSKCRK